MASRTSASASREVRSTSCISCLATLRITIHQLARQFRLQGNERKRVSQQIVQVASDALALRDLGQVLDLILGALKFFCCTVADRRVMASESHDGNQQQQRSPGT